MRLLLLACALVACSPSDGDGSPTDAGDGGSCTAFDAGPPGSPPVDAGDETTPDVGPVVTRVEIDDIIKNSCSFSTCHGKKPGAGGLFLEPPPGNWTVSLINVASTTHKTMKRVVPYDPQKSFLVHKLGAGLCALAKDCVDGTCGDRMPQTSSPLPSDEIAKIVEWIRQGASDK